MYTWRMHYNVDGEPQAELRQPDGTVMTALRFRGLEFLKKQTANFLLLIKLLCREMLTPLPAGTSAALCLTYTDRAPAGYQAPSFRPLLDYPVLPPDTQYVELARLQTEYHRVSVVVRSVFIDDGYVMKLRLNEELRLHIKDYSAFTPFEEESDEDNRDHRNAALQQTCAAAIGLLPPWTTQGVRHRYGGTKERGQPIHKSSGSFVASDSHGTPSVRKTPGVTDIGWVGLATLYSLLKNYQLREGNETLVVVKQQWFGLGSFRSLRRALLLTVQNMFGNEDRAL
ncbi:unnamed protein product [Angiostrongylus costaricensis]|uniref:HORMA domain-containing protein n=1 Tax=Angiostrongylus costaricensis TaxID=334426 RepID=A0A0R3PH26_ANGCS|nr:unnamed protein product [Angiostrongylus costaricensis]